MNAAEPMQAVAATVELDGVRLFTRRAGDGPPVVVLHGGPGAHHDYLLPQYDRLARGRALYRSEEHTSELQSQSNLVCRLLLEKKKKKNKVNLTSTYNSDRKTHIVT